jgi:hypothetical protein
MAGTWSALKNQPSFNAGTLLLLTDGTVMCQDSGTANWWRFSPDSSGSYAAGTWSVLASGPNAPLYFVSAVLKDGRVLVAGGEYDNGSQVDLLAAEIYDPVTDSWTPIATPDGWTHIGDAPSCVLPDGKVLIGSIDDIRTAIYDPAANQWTAGASKDDSSSEETWTLIPDGTVLSVECTNLPRSEKYVASANKWVSAGNTPSALPQPCPGIVGEIGPALLLPDGRVFAIGASGNTALYSPSANASSPGSWAAGPTMLDANGKTLFAMDAPACLLPNGNVLVCGSPSPPCDYPPPTTFLEFEAPSNKLTLVPSPGNAGTPCFQGRMLLLPTGQVLFANGSNDVEVYSPEGTSDPAWKPQITTVPSTVKPKQTCTLQGRQLNGLSQAVSYGDDAQMATNYPLVCLRSIADDRVFYARTFDHSTMGVATGSVIHSTQFQVPSDVSVGVYQLFVIANGIWSDPAEVKMDPNS